MITRRLVPSVSRSSLAVAGPRSRRCLATRSLACAKAAASMTSSALISMLRRNREETQRLEAEAVSAASSLRDGGSSGLAVECGTDAGAGGLQRGWQASGRWLARLIAVPTWAKP